MTTEDITVGLNGIDALKERLAILRAKLERIDYKLVLEENKR